MANSRSVPDIQASTFIQMGGPSTKIALLHNTDEVQIVSEVATDVAITNSYLLRVRCVVDGSDMLFLNNDKLCVEVYPHPQFLILMKWGP